MMAYLQLVVEILKLLNMFITNRILLKKEEYALFKERFQGILDMIDKSINRVQDAFNEDAFLNNRDWEFKKRYETYKAECIAILTVGGGIKELSASPKSGMGQLVYKIQPKIIEILNLTTTVKDKSALIAKTLLEPITATA